MEPTQKAAKPFIFYGVRDGGLLFEAVQIREELAVDELNQVVASLRLVVVNGVVFAFWCSP